MDGKGWATDNAHVNRFIRTIKYNKLYLGPSKDRNMFTNVAMNSLLTTTTKDAIKHINIRCQVLFNMLPKKLLLFFINQAQLFA